MSGGGSKNATNPRTNTGNFGDMIRDNPDARLSFGQWLASRFNPSDRVYPSDSQPGGIPGAAVVSSPIQAPPEPLTGHAALDAYLQTGRMPSYDELYGTPVTFSGGGTTTTPTSPSTPTSGGGAISNGTYDRHGQWHTSEEISRMHPRVQVNLFGGVNPYTGPEYNPGGSPAPVGGGAVGGGNNAGLGYDYPTENAGYIWVNPARRGKTAASDTMADIAKAEYADYERRYQPIEDMMINQLKRENYDRDVTGRELLRTGVSIGGAYNNIAGQDARRMSRYGVNYRQDPNWNNKQVSAMVGGLNDTRTMSEDRRLQLIGGGLNPVATAVKNPDYEKGDG